MDKKIEEIIIESQINHFNSIAKQYFEARKSDKHLEYKKLLWKHVLQNLKFEQSNLQVVEAMCGYCEGKEILENNLKCSINYEGFDYSDEMIAIARKIHPNTKIYKMDITCFAEEEKYDVIILIGGLHHVPTYLDKSLKNIHNALKKDGLFINFEPTSNNILCKKIRERIYRTNVLFDDLTERDFSLKEINQAYLKNNFKIEKQFYPGLIGYILWYNPDAFKKLNIGDVKTVKRGFNLEKKLYSTGIGKKLSFATLTIMRK